MSLSEARNKKIDELLNELPEPYRSEAIANRAAVSKEEISDFCAAIYPVETIYDALSHGFLWQETEQGFDYWAKIAQELHDKELQSV